MSIAYQYCILFNIVAQITDWRLLFYGTAIPPQPNDPPRFGKPGQMGPDLDHNSLEFEGERASGQWRETHQVNYLFEPHPLAQLYCKITVPLTI